MVTKSAEVLSLQSPQGTQVEIFVRQTNRLTYLVIQKEIIINKRTFETGKIHISKMFGKHEKFCVPKKIFEAHSRQTVALNGRLTDRESGNQKVCRKQKISIIKMGNN